MPLDGLWPRGPYLHNGSVPLLRDLLTPPAGRPVTFLRASDVADRGNGGFVTMPCNTAALVLRGSCFDTQLPGNGNSGHT